MNLSSLQKSNPSFFTGKVVKAGNNTMRPGNIKMEAIKALLTNTWISYGEIMKRTGFTNDIVSRAAVHLSQDGTAVIKRERNVNEGQGYIRLIANG